VSRVRESQNFGSNCNGSQKEAGVHLCRNPVCSVFRPGADPAHEEKARDQSHGESLLSLWCPTSAIIPRQRRYSERPCSQSSGGIAWQKNLWTWCATKAHNRLGCEHHAKNLQMCKANSQKEGSAA